MYNIEFTSDAKADLARLAINEPKHMSRLNALLKN
jgi:hypothetical protein